MAAAAAVVFVLVLAVHARSAGGPRAAPYGEHGRCACRDAADRAGAARARCGCASRTRAFWILAGTFFICGASTNGLIGTHLIAACHDYGIPAGPLGAAARDDGHLRHPRHDRLGVADRSLLEPSSAVRLLHAARPVAAVPAGHAGHGGRQPRHGSRCSTASTGSRPCRRRCRLTTEAFGRENTGVVYGWIGASHQLGASMAAFGAGAIRTSLGDYRSRSGSPACCACSRARRSCWSAGRCVRTRSGRDRRPQPAS